jgi:serine/threonine-protein kinase
MATVFQMRHRLHGGLFVAKVLHPWLAEEVEFRGRFRTEAMHGAILSGHPHVVPVIDLAEIDGLFYMVMPYIDGEDLDHILRRVGHLERSEALTLTAQVTSALVAAEAQGIVHCDISPGNIRLDRFGHYRLMDFGLSERASSMAQNFKRAAPTPSYASPELWIGIQADIRSDLYSLGVVLLEALTGLLPFLGKSEVEIMQRHLAGDWLMPPAIGRDATMAALLRELLARKREERVQSATELAKRLESMGYPLAEFRARSTPHAPARTNGERRDRARRISHPTDLS